MQTTAHIGETFCALECDEALANTLESRLQSHHDTPLDAQRTTSEESVVLGHGVAESDGGGGVGRHPIPRPRESCANSCRPTQPDAFRWPIAVWISHASRLLCETLHPGVLYYVHKKSTKQVPLGYDLRPQRRQRRVSIKHFNRPPRTARGEVRVVHNQPRFSASQLFAGLSASGICGRHNRKTPD